MRLTKGKLIVSGNPTIKWIEKMKRLGMVFTHKDGKIYAEFERK